MDQIDPLFPQRGQQGWASPWLGTVQEFLDTANLVDTSWAQIGAALTPAPPVAQFTVTTSGRTATLDATNSTGPITSYAWTFGDGFSGPGATVNHTYAADGTYTVTLTVTTAAGVTATTSQSIHVGTTAPTNVPPTASFTFTQGTGTDSYRLNVTAVASSDPDGSIVGYHWNFGNTVTFDTTNPVANGFYYTAPGTYTVTLTVTDNLGATATASRVVTVKAPPPTADFTATPSGLTVGVDASASTAPTGANITAYAWNFGDTAITVPVYTMALGGKVVGLSPSIGNMLQCAVKNVNTGNIYATQARNGSNGTTTPYESTQLSRMDATGALIDSMTLTDAGHGTSFALEYTGGKTYVWLTWQKAASGGQDWDIVRFPYPVGGGTFTRSSPPTGMTVPYPGGLTSGATKTDVAAFDTANDRAVLRTVHSGSNTFQQVVLSDFLAGTITVLHTLTLPDGPPSIQGYSTVNQSLFRYTGTYGAAPSPTDPPLITEYRWSDGAVVSTLSTASLGRNADGTYPGGRFEPESCTIYQSGTTLELWVGMITGTTGAYNYNLYRVPLTASTQTVTVPSTATGKNATHTYAAAGTYPILLKVTDSNGNTGTVTHSVTVTATPTNTPPNAAFSFTQGTGSDSFRLNVDASASSDPDGSIVLYHWDFGNGVLYDTTNPIANGFYYTAPGTVTVTLTVTDNAGATRSTSKTVTVVAPTGTSSSGYTNDNGLGTNGGAQVTGTAYVAFNTGGSDFGAQATAVGAGKFLSLPPSVLKKLKPLTSTVIHAADITAGGGVVGAGSSKSIVEQTAGSSTGATVVTNGTTASELVRVTAANVLLQDFQLLGTPQSVAIMHGLDIRATNPTVRRVKLVGAAPGNDKQPPGETFGLSLNSGTGGLVEDVEIDGQGHGASNFGLNSWHGPLTVNRLYSHDNPYSGGLAFWQTWGGVTLNDSVFDKCRCFWNIERCTDTVILNRPRIGVLQAATSGWAGSPASAIGIFCETDRTWINQHPGSFRFEIHDPRNLDGTVYNGPKITVNFGRANDGGTQFYGTANFRAYNATGTDISSSFFTYGGTPGAGTW